MNFLNKKKTLNIFFLIIFLASFIIYPTQIANGQTNVPGVNAGLNLTNWGAGNENFLKSGVADKIIKTGQAIGNAVGKGVGNIVDFTGGSLLWILAEFANLLSSLLLDFSTWFMQWILNDPIKSKTGTANLHYYTNPANAIIGEGWTLTRNLVNLLLIIGLAYIGFATAVGIAGYETQKTLLKLVGLALLVNFTPLILGVMVDLANIISGSFTTGMTEQFSVMQDAVDKLSADIQFGAKASDLGPEFMKSMLTTTFAFFIAIIFIGIGMYHFLRHLMLWILTILSPLAFFALIFDKTKGYFNMWWKQFSTWAFAIVPISFFLYLASVTMSTVDWTDYSGDPTDGAFPMLLKFFAVGMILLIGFLMSFSLVNQFMGMAAQGVNAGKKIIGSGVRGSKFVGRNVKGAAVTAGGVAYGAKKGIMDEAKKLRAGDGNVKASVGNYAKMIGGGIKGGTKGGFTRKGRMEFEENAKRGAMGQKMYGAYVNRQVERAKSEKMKAKERLNLQRDLARGGSPSSNSSVSGSTTPPKSSPSNFANGTADNYNDVQIIPDTPQDVKVKREKEKLKKEMVAGMKNRPKGKGISNARNSIEKEGLKNKMFTKKENIKAEAAKRIKNSKGKGVNNINKDAA